MHFKNGNGRLHTMHLACRASGLYPLSRWRSSHLTTRLTVWEVAVVKGASELRPAVPLMEEPVSMMPARALLTLETHTLGDAGS
ncbi:hypothetical protein NDA11_005862 [Ustilago hordei]|nr:hypothetical protein NDA10_005192 [Ustilago hordei]KAJ1580690.1 hypothetical protein NDA12_004593 [Ustilago hordei]KAJ1581563.1 hypothetical protein NDA11_005862 [Ustilago hordei]KAJ1597438.1 hypothetical protein NDA14_007944 [Ustilago hordei]UTT92026.1 hypothetical protein NDA17_004544 [Ustilago hordei]